MSFSSIRFIILKKLEDLKHFHQQNYIGPEI
jgi:hypothetical protein